MVLAGAAVFTHVLRPQPAEMTQKDPQRVVFQGTAQLLSPYKVEKQSLEVGAAGATACAQQPACTGLPVCAQQEGCRPCCRARCSPTACHGSTHPPPSLLQLAMSESGEKPTATEVAPTKVASSRVSYGPYTQTAPFSSQPISGTAAVATGECLWPVCME